MKIDTTPANIAELGNIQSTSEFSIKANYHSFQILSSGLYANKIRAIVRELSCNAWDSHVATGNSDKPFDLHLPTYLEPYFSIRDYGTGLTHDQVVNIYTTYFESTKTDSNDFIGALGLGSKSPFSYTENFTVTAICNGMKGVYTAFINEQGIPSVARMADVETDEPNGVEVKFSVDNNNDFHKFAEESRTVFSYFPVKPDLTGEEIYFHEPEYEELNIVDGINVFKDVSYAYRRSGMSSSVAVMGNISYPINIPNAEGNLGDLVNLLDKSLELRFDIGEVEFQASREGLSYTKFTIETIRKKLELLQSKLDAILFSEADAIENVWERSLFLVKKLAVSIWNGSVRNYMKQNPDFDGFDNSSYYGHIVKRYKLDPAEIEQKFNISIRSFGINRTRDVCHTIGLQREYKNGVYVNRICFSIEKGVKFVKYNKTRGGIAHGKYHFKTNRLSVLGDDHNASVYVLSPVNKDDDAKYDDFFEHINNPPTDQIYEMDDLDEKPKAVRNNDREKNVSILYLNHNIYQNTLTWKDGNKLDQYSDTGTFYYMPLSGYSPVCKDGYFESDVKQLWNQLNETGLDKMLGISVLYGVRKSDIDVILGKKNWINIQEHLISEISKMDSKTLMPVAIRGNVRNDLKHILDKIVKKSENTEFGKFFSGVDLNNMNGRFDSHTFTNLYKKYTKTENGGTIYETAKSELQDFMDKYPLINNICYDYRDKEQVIEQIVQVINMVEQN